MLEELLACSHWNWNVFVLWWVWRLSMWFKRKGTAVIFEFSSSFDSNYATFKSNDTAPISLQCCGGLGRILKGGRGSNFAAGVIAAQRHCGRFNFTLRAQNYIWFCRLHCLGPPPTLWLLPPGENNQSSDSAPSHGRVRAATNANRQRAPAAVVQASAVTEVTRDWRVTARKQ